MPRRNRPQDSRSRAKRSSGPSRQQDSGLRDGGFFGINPAYRQEESFDGRWHVRDIPATRALKTYRCPGCLRDVPPGQAHIVAWRADWLMGDEQAGEYRRHWHTACWRNRRHDGR